MEVGHTVDHQDVPALLVLGVDFVLQTWAHIHIGFAGTLAGIRTAAAGNIGKLVPAGHNLAGVDVPQEAGIGMVGIPSMVVVDMAAADTVCYYAHPCSEADLACSTREVHMVAEVPDTADLYPKQENSMPGHVVEVGHSQVAHEVCEVDVCLVLAGLEKLCSLRVYSVEECYHKVEHTPSTSFDDIEHLGEVDLDNNSKECCYEPMDYPQWSHHNIED